MQNRKALIFIAFWVSGVTVLMAGLMTLHTAPLSAYNIKASSKGAWTVQHILSSDCRCSQKVFESLIARGLQSDRAEQIVLLKDDLGWSDKLKAAGFEVSVLDLEVRQEIVQSEADFGVPALVVYSPKGERAYVGGYSEGVLSSGGPNREAEVVSHFIYGTAARNFPIRGCAVTASYQKRIDPFSFKYRVSGVKNVFK